MTTASLSSIEDVDHGAVLVDEIERYLAARARATAPKTAHPLVSVPTQALVDEALARLDERPADPAPQLRGPAAILRRVPDKVLRKFGRRTTRPVSVAEHLELTALVIEQYGWAQQLRSRSGRRCIAGAQTVLHHLGYGDRDTIAAAGRQLEIALQARGHAGPYYRWNDRAGRTRNEVLDLIRTAAASAERTRR